jgi:hypothetical protein
MVWGEWCCVCVRVCVCTASAQIPRVCGKGMNNDATVVRCHPLSFDTDEATRVL